MNLLAKEILQKAHDGIPLNKRDRAIVKYGFTGREVQVLEFISVGLIDKGIADALSISYKTVMKHKDNLYQKLPVRGTAKATHFAIANGFVELMDL